MLLRRLVPLQVQLNVQRLLDLHDLRRLIAHREQVPGGPTATGVSTDLGRPTFLLRKCGALPAPSPTLLCKKENWSNK
jgi:hypothetical protein